MRSDLLSLMTDNAISNDITLLTKIRGQLLLNPNKYQELGQKIGDLLKPGLDKLAARTDLKPEEVDFQQKLIVLHIGRVKVIDRDLLEQYALSIKNWLRIKHITR